MNKYLLKGNNTLRIQQIGCACVSCIRNPRIWRNLKLIHQLQQIDKQHCMQSYNFCIQIHARHSENSLKFMVDNSTISIQKSHHLIDSLLGAVQEGEEEEEDDELQIIQQSVKVSLKCPITMKRMKMPVRGKQCKHVDVSRSILTVS